MSESGPPAPKHLPGWRGRWPVPILILMCLLAWLPGAFSLPPLDRDESRFAQASKQMIESGDYVDIRFSTVPRYNKPVGIYWAQAAATRLLGHPPYNQIWTYRVPSLIGGILAVLLTYWCARAFLPPGTSLIAGAFLALTVLLTSEAMNATTDALLLATVVGAQGVLLRLYLNIRGALVHRPGLCATLCGWAAVGAGVLLKGPVILAVLSLTILAVSFGDRSWAWLRSLHWKSGVPLMLAVVLPWAVAIAIASHGAFYQRSLEHDLTAKLLGGQESHGAPPGYYVLLAAATLWPATLVLLPGVGFAILHRAEPAIRFLLAWAIPSWLLFELVPTKLPHYILPVYPALCLVAATWMDRQDTAPATRRHLETASLALFAIAGIALSAASVTAPLFIGQNIRPLWWLYAAAGMALVLGAAISQHSRRQILGLTLASTAALLLYPFVSAVVAPALSPIWISRTMAAHMARDEAQADPPAVLAGYVEPSAVFLLGTDTHLQSGQGAGKLAAQQGGLALIEDHQRTHFLQALHAAGGRERAIDQVSGFNYSRGRREHVTFYRVAPARQ